MLFISVDDFYQKTCGMKNLSMDDVKKHASKMADGDTDARQAIINSYLPMVASYIRRSPKEIQTLQTVYCCVRILEECVDNFNFLQESETFIHHLGLRLRQCITRCIVNKC